MRSSVTRASSLLDGMKNIAKKIDHITVSELLTFFPPNQGYSN